MPPLKQRDGCLIDKMLFARVGQFVRPPQRGPEIGSLTGANETGKGSPSSLWYAHVFVQNCKSTLEGASCVNMTSELYGILAKYINFSIPLRSWEAGEGGSGLGTSCDLLREVYI